MVLGRHGYETAVKGNNGFVCIVWRSWAAGIDNPDFWNPKLRSPVCLNPPASRFNVPLTLKRTELILAGRSKSQMFADMSTAFDKKEFRALEPGAMLSKQGYLRDRDGHWRPHLMFFVPLTEPASWGTGLPGSPVVVAFTDTPGRLTVFLIPAAKWSDGTAAPIDEHGRVISASLSPSNRKLFRVMHSDLGSQRARDIRFGCRSLVAIVLVSAARKGTREVHGKMSRANWLQFIRLDW
jgi:hypothetical protein